MRNDPQDAYIALTNAGLSALIDEAVPTPLLKESMGYSVFPGGKRLRPVLCMAACELAGGRAQEALYPACALEFIHTYSLIHDDLPAMDDDGMRRGKPSSHVAFGEANAILAGDALQALAFVALAKCSVSAASRAIACAALEMVAGQSLDVNAGPDNISLERLQRYKTGALFRAAVEAGAACASAPESLVAALLRFADAYGLLFQITDDILDCTGDEAALGKSVGKDAAGGKVTFVTRYGVEAAAAYARGYAAEAREALAETGGDASFFLELIERTLSRRS